MIYYEKAGWQVNTGVAILAPVLGALASIVVFYFYVSATRTDAAFLNVAGRQRMLSQQILVETMTHPYQGSGNTHKMLVTLVDRFDRSLNVLQYGGRIMDRQLPPAPRELQPDFDDIRPVWNDTKLLLFPYDHEHLRPAKSRKNHHGVDKKLPELIHTLRTRSDKLVSSYEAYSNELRSGMLNAIYAVGLLDMCLLIFGVAALRQYISERRKTMMTLHRQADVIDQIQDAVIETDLEGVITGWNGGAQQLLGYDPVSVIGKSVSSIFSESGIGLLKEELLDSLMRNGHSEMEANEYRKSGERICVHLSLSLRRDDKGKPVGIICYAIDITEKRRMALVFKKLAGMVSTESDDTFFQLIVKDLAESLSVSHVMMAEVDETNNDLVNTVAIYADAEIVENFTYENSGITRENLDKKDVCFYHSDIQKKYPDDELLSRMGASSYVGISLKGTSDKMAGLIAVMDRKPFAEPELAKSLLQVFADRVSAELGRKHASDRLKHSEHEWRLTFDSISDMVSLHDNKYRIVRANKKVAEYADRPINQILGEKCYKVFHCRDEK